MLPTGKGREHGRERHCGEGTGGLQWRFCGYSECVIVSGRTDRKAGVIGG